MAEQLAVEVDVKNVTYGTQKTEHGRRNTEHRTRNMEHGTQTSSFIWLGYKGMVWSDLINWLTVD